jgi:hypothetical protein
MKKSFSQLKKDLKNNVGATLKVIYHFRGNEDKSLLEDRKIARVQSNAITTTRENNPKECWLYFPNSANLVEYIDNTFTMYEARI